jgi:hypothetical protein
MSTDNDSEEETLQMFRYVSVMNVCPARAFLEGVKPGQPVPEEGEKMASITFGYDGEVEQPVMLSLSDASRLIADLLSVLAHHGSEYAQAIFDEHFAGKDPQRFDGETGKG